MPKLKTSLARRAAWCPAVADAAGPHGRAPLAHARGSASRAFEGAPNGTATVRERSKSQTRRFRGVLLAVIGTLGLVATGVAQTAGDLETPAVNRIAEKLNCPCGCMMNMACKMDPYPCGTCRRAKVKIFEMQGAGKSDQQILDSFVADPEYGKKVLAIAPGFWGVAGIWTAVLIGLGMVVVAMRRYMRHKPSPALANAPEIDPETMARIEKDLNKLD